MLSTPFDHHIINYEPSRGFIVRKFTIYDGINDLFDHIMHFMQLMTLDIGNDALLCKNIKLQENESLRDFMKRFEQVVLQVESCSVNRVLQLYEDALVLTLGVGKFDMRRLLVDPGSSVDLFKMSAYKKMSYSPSALENLRCLLSRFNGATMTSLSDVVLPVQVGPVTLNIQFLMVDDLSPYNPIMRRAWLRKMKVIPSTYHQMVSYLMEKGQVDLLGIEFIIEVKYLDWLENLVVVPKKNGRWRVCIDYTNLNDVYPNDNFPLPRINQIVDSIVGHGMFSFLEAFSRYHQIPMFQSNEEKTTFITPYGLYCYKVMSFGLKNASATYQRLMTNIFKPLIGRIMRINFVTSRLHARGMEVIIPIEIGMPIAKTVVQDQKDNDEELIRQLDCVDKLQGKAAIWIASYHQRAITQYNKRTRPRFFRPGSLVFRRFFENTVEVGARKLQSNWEWPYVVTKGGDLKAYHLQTLDGVPLLRPWNVILNLGLPFKSSQEITNGCLPGSLKAYQVLAILGNLTFKPPLRGSQEITNGS
uniref:Reverse transcriptase domain-containing protein n=1 Tax=Vitis vinifera TaxID=29760 RepID=A5BTT4_VITVI|nr:hypothetical protein VITISV_044076 [Vitis vinifera]